jgi:hypothetical protein
VNQPSESLSDASHQSAPAALAGDDDGYRDVSTSDQMTMRKRFEFLRGCHASRYGDDNPDEDAVAWRMYQAIDADIGFAVLVTAIAESKTSRTFADFLHCLGTAGHPLELVGCDDGGQCDHDEPF